VGGGGQGRGGRGFLFPSMQGGGGGGRKKKKRKKMEKGESLFFFVDRFKRLGLKRGTLS